MFVGSLAASYLYPSFQGLLSDNDTVRLGLDFQRMLRINHMLYIAARSVATHLKHLKLVEAKCSLYLTRPWPCLCLRLSQGPRVCCESGRLLGADHPTAGRRNLIFLFGLPWVVLQSHPSIHGCKSLLQESDKDKICVFP